MCHPEERWLSGVVKADWNVSKKGEELWKGRFLKSKS